jgi:glutathione S-transferase
MTQYRLTYFDIDGGRAEPIRIAFHIAGVPFEDNRISFEEFMDGRSALRFTCVPVLEIDGKPVTQSNALSRYIGKMAGLYPEDPLQALYCDEVLGALEDLTNQIGRTMRLQGDELRAAREQLSQGWIPTYLRGLSELLERGGGEYFADNRLTVADLRAFIETRWLTSGFLDHIPTDIVTSVAPTLAEHNARIAAEPRIAAYYAGRH